MGVECSHETYLSQTKDEKDGQRYWADFDKDYFAKGTYRYAFQGTLHGEGKRDGELCVTKVFKAEYARKFAKWVPDLAASQRAHNFAMHFNKDVIPCLRKYVGDAKIEFIIPLIAQLQSLSHFKVLGLFPIGEDSKYVDIYEHVAIEPFLHGQYEKYNNNGGYEDANAALLTTFTHWTWCASGHRMMVCDLQGVRNGRRYTLTDPCIHSVEKSYGLSDMGVIGMEKMLCAHQCNTLCKVLGLTNPLDGAANVSNYTATTYYADLRNSEQNRAKHGQTPYFNMDHSVLDY